MCYQILSRDSVTVSVDAVVYFNVIDAEQALCSVDDFRLDLWVAVGRSRKVPWARCSHGTRECFTYPVSLSCNNAKLIRLTCLKMSPQI